MAINDISLTAGMRANLLSLQGTVNLLERTQSRLSSGNKVNSALDNPTSYFASQVLNSRASKIDGLKDAMGQAIQTVQAADKGIKGITSLIEQAKGVAQSAQSVEAGTGFSTVTISLASVADGEILTLQNVGNVTHADLTAAALTPTVASIDIVLGAANSITQGENIVVGGKTYTASVGGSSEGLTFVWKASTALTAAELQGRVTANAGAALTASIETAGTVHIHAGTVGLTDTTADDGTAGAKVTVTNNAGTPIAAPGTDEFIRTGNNIVDAIALADLINNVAGGSVGAFSASLDTLHDEGYTASASNGVVTISKALGTSAAADVTIAANIAAHTTTIEAADVAADSELLSLMTQYNEMRAQITAMAEDSGYKGKNLLDGTADTAATALTVQFEGSTLAVVGFDATVTGLGVNEATWTTGTASTKIAADIVLLDDALTTLRQNASSLSGNLSIIRVRQDFSTDMVNTLTEGSNKLTLADTNEEGANMLMLQTRQSLSTTALSLSAQAAQSVLRLFQ